MRLLEFKLYQQSHRTCVLFWYSFCVYEIVLKYYIKMASLFVRRRGSHFNTKTKLDLTKLFYSQSFTTPFLFGTKICIYYLLNKQE